MAHARYFVSSVDNRWTVTLNGAFMGRFGTRTEAIEAAIVMADLMGAMQHDADVMAQFVPDAPLELVWRYGTDKTPRPRRPAQSMAGAPDTTIRHARCSAV